MAGPTISIEKLQKKLEKDPTPIGYLQLAEEYRKEGMYHDAIRTCLEGLKKHPNYWSTRVSMGRVYYEMGDSEKAREELEKVIKAVPDNLLANRILGEIYMSANRLQDALKRFKLVEMLSSADQEVAANIHAIEGKLANAAPLTATKPRESKPAEPVAEIKLPPPPLPPAQPAPAAAKLDALPGFHESPFPMISELSPPTIEIAGAATQEMPAPKLPKAIDDLPLLEEMDSFAPTKILPPIDLDATAPAPSSATFVPSPPEKAAPSDLSAMESLFLEGTHSNESISNSTAIAHPESLPGLHEFVEVTAEPPAPKTEDITQPMAEELEPDEEEEADELTSQTLAELYVKQGHTDKAIKVYQKLLLNDPNNTDIVHRLKELNPADALLASAMNEEPARPTVPKPSRPGEEPYAATLAAANSRGADDAMDERRRKISTLENWLSAIRRERN